jgi:hypothetical protein
MVELWALALLFAFQLVERSRVGVSCDLHGSVGAGIHCNPGAAYTEVGVSEEEVETLAGEKEGCGDEIDFIEVQRPATVADIESGSDNLSRMQACQLLCPPLCSDCCLGCRDLGY